MTYARWRSVGTVVEGGEVQVLQQKVKAGLDSPTKPARDNEHRLVPLRELEGVRPNDEAAEGVDRL